MMEERKLCKSKSDLEHFVNIKWMWIAYCAFGFVDLTIKIEKTTAWQQSNEKSTRLKWTTAFTNASECVCEFVWKCPTAESEAINLNFHCENLDVWLGRAFATDTQHNRTQSFDYILCENPNRRGFRCVDMMVCPQQQQYRLINALAIDWLSGFFRLSILCQLLHHLAI